MKASLLVLIAVGAGACGRTSRPPPDVGEGRAAVAAAHRVGTPAPAMTVTTIDGDRIDLATLYGAKPVYLKFWATWCVPCREQMPGFERIYERLGDQLQVIAVNVGLDDDAAAVREFRTKYGLHMPIVVDDGRLAAALDLQVTPQHVLIGRDARIAYIGHLDGKKLDAAIQQVLAETPTTAAGPAAEPRAPVDPAFARGDLVGAREVTTTAGTKVQLGVGAAGRPRALVLFSTWCESYLEESVPATSRACRRVREEVDRLSAKGDVEWLGIAHGLWTSMSDVTEYQATTHTRLPLVLDTDGSLFRAFGVHNLPTVVLLDGEGRVQRVVGPTELDLAAAVETLTTAPPHP